MKTWKVKAGDLNFNVQGRMRWIEDDEKVAQDVADHVLKRMYTITVRRKAGKAGSNVYIERQLLSAIDDLILAQKTNSRTSKREKISFIKQFVTVPDPEDPTRYYFLLEIRTAAGDNITKVFDSETLMDLSHLGFSPGLSDIPFLSNYKGE